MKVFQTVPEIQKYLLETNGLGKTVGFIPTMGALHKGHLSLVNASKAKTDITVCSIFVNPTQFNDPADFAKYPISLDSDLEMLLETGCDVVFVPTLEEIYPNGVHEKADVNLGFIGTSLEAAYRPGHFEGVLQVVKRLLDIVQPDFLFMGRKDYQQCRVIARLIELYHLPVQLEICDTVREPDGLAMSSRNARLNEEERKSALKLSKAIQYIKDHIGKRTAHELIDEQFKQLAEDPLIKVEYIAVVNGNTLEPVKEAGEGIPITILIAAKVGAVRLIDNMIIP